MPRALTHSVTLAEPLLLSVPGFPHLQNRPHDPYPGTLSGGRDELSRRQRPADNARAHHCRCHGPHRPPSSRPPSLPKPHSAVGPRPSHPAPHGSPQTEAAPPGEKRLLADASLPCPPTRDRHSRKQRGVMRQSQRLVAKWGRAGAGSRGPGLCPLDTLFLPLFWRLHRGLAQPLCPSPGRLPPPSHLYPPRPHGLTQQCLTY